MGDLFRSTTSRLRRLGVAISGWSTRLGSRGQATAEYVLVLLGAASVALVLIGWLARSGRIEGLLDHVFDSITAQL